MELNVMPLSYYSIDLIQYQQKISIQFEMTPILLLKGCECEKARSVMDRK